MTKMFSVSGKRVILNMEHSKIGYGYPRVFIETEPDQEYINLDVFLGTPFRMAKGALRIGPLTHNPWKMRM